VMLVSRWAAQKVEYLVLLLGWLKVEMMACLLEGEMAVLKALMVCSKEHQ